MLDAVDIVRLLLCIAIMKLHRILLHVAAAAAAHKHTYSYAHIAYRLSAAISC